MFESLDRLLETFVEQPQWQEYQQLQRLYRCWAEIVGEKAAQQTRPQGIAKDVLYVATSNSVWVQELKFKRRQILRQLNSRLSTRLEDIRFSTARWQREPELEGSAPSASVLWQEHPSRLEPPSEQDLRTDATYRRGEPFAPPQGGSASPPPSAKDPQAAFQRWAEFVQARSQNLPPCPQCHCPTPPGELQRWQVCSLCATKQWQH
jgi:predicted nucleic acid-binding Zn ribbon protein